jgi:glycosyltransferase involved in cell wall biosynthesis
VTTVPQTLFFFLGHVLFAKKSGFEVHALSSPDDRLDAFGERAGITVHPVAMARRITPLSDLLSLWRICRCLRRTRPDIVHGHTPKGGLLAMLAAWICGVPVRIYHMHGLPVMTARGYKRVLLRWSEKVSCRLATQVFCVSRSLGEVAAAEGLCSPRKIKVLLHGSVGGLDAEQIFNPACHPDARRRLRTQYGIPADALVAGFVGRIVRDKGLIELTEAWKELRTEFPNLHLLLVGPFEPQDPVPAEVEAILRNDPRIHLAGEIRDVREIPGVYPAMDLFVLPTYREGFGMVLLEAMGLGLPTVATRIPGCVDAVRDGETGLLVPARDAGALAVAVRLYLNDPELRRRHGEAGRRRALRDFRPEALQQALYQEYVELLKSARRCDGRPVPPTSPHPMVSDLSAN